MLEHVASRVRRPTRFARSAAVVGTVALILGASNRPIQAQTDGARASNMELIGHTDLGGLGANAAVWGHRTFAYVGTAGRRSPAGSGACGGRGVTIVDIAEPARPVVAGSLAAYASTTAEDVQVMAVDSPAFRGDLLATGIQRCSAEGVGGLGLWDVTDPRSPTELGFFGTGRGTGGVHEFSMFRRDGLTLGLLAVPFSETLDAETQGDLRIVDLSDPRAPVQLAHWGIGRALGIGARDGRGRDSQNYAHSVRASLDGRLAYVAYWDAGVVILDISDLRNPRYLGRTTFGPDEEGNAHSGVLAKGGRILIQADEDYVTRSETVLVEGESLSGALEASYGTFRAVLAAAPASGGSAVYVGRGCPAREVAPTTPEDPYLTDPTDRVAIVDRGDCTFVEKVLRAQRAGAVGVVIANGTPAVTTMEGDVSSVRIPAAMIGKDSADRLKEALARAEPIQISFCVDQIRYDDWGYLRLWDVADPANPVRVSTFATENARTDRQSGPPDNGWYTAHQPVVLGDRLYASWYSDGVRVVDIADPTRPREVGYFIPPSGEPRQDGSPYPDRPFVWGVYVRGDLILASDVHTGLYLLRDLSR